MLIMNKKELFKIMVFFLLFSAFSILFAFKEQHNKNEQYSLAKSYLSNREYNKAQDLFDRLGKFKDSEYLLDQTSDFILKKEIYDKALEDYKYGDYDSALTKLDSIREFEDSQEQINAIIYELAVTSFNNNQLEQAKKYFFQIEDYNDSADYISKIELKLSNNIIKTAYAEAVSYYNDGFYQKALDIFIDLDDYRDSQEKAALCEENLQRINLSHKLAGGIRHSLGIIEDGKVKSAGNNLNGQCNVALWENIISIDGYGIYTIGLKKDGTVEVAGNLSEKQRIEVASWEHIVDVAAGERYVVALKSDGKVVSEGHNGDGQCYVDNFKNIIDLDAGWRFTVGLTKNGELQFAGLAQNLINEFMSDKEAWKDVIKISASGGEPKGKQRGKGHVVGLKQDGTLVAIGDNEYGQCDVNGDEWKDIIKVAAGDWYTVALTKNGKVLITGQNKENTYYINDEKRKTWENIKDIAAGYGQTLVLKDDGYIDVMGFDDDFKISDALRWNDLNK